MGRQLVKADIAKAISEAADLTMVEAERAVELLFQVMKESFSKGQHIELRGFGVFKVRQRKHGIARNPKTGKTVPIAPGRAVRFKPGKDLENLPLDPQ